ncbi:MAG: RNA polymerase subunit sigma-70 [Rickettsiales bacterium]|nr:RNA polymerase subunit sigma-70 [Rickettsiales bacterium]|tara:strand:+ start:385 stop:1605 length:1221 start_codon:yes stop_codon:yes gene_type:complete
MSEDPKEQAKQALQPDAVLDPKQRLEVETVIDDSIEAAASAHRIESYTDNPITLDVPALGRGVDTASLLIDDRAAAESNSSLTAETKALANDTASPPAVTDFRRNTVGSASLQPRAEDSFVAVRDPLQAYMAEVSRYDLLTVEEEVDLASRYQQHGDPEAAYKLVTANLRLVAKIAFKYRRYYKNVLDLIQEGNIGLMKAVQKFDPNRGVRLSTYARYWIQAYVMYFLLANHRIVKVGTTQAKRKLFYNLNKETRRLKQMGFDPTPDRIAENLDVEVKDVIEMQQRLGSPDASLDQPIGQEDDRTLGQTIPSSSPDLDVQVGEAEMMNLVSASMRSFGKTIDKPRELVIWHERLMAEEPLTLEEVGQRFGVTRERVRQIEARMKQRLKAHLLKEMGTEVELSVDKP